MKQKLKHISEFLHIIPDFILILFLYLRNRYLKKEKNLKKELLLIRLDSIGDVVIWLDSFKEYKHLYPNDEWQITLLCNDVCLDILEKTGYANYFIALKRDKFKKNIKYRFNIYKLLVEKKFDVVLNSSYSREFHFGDILTFSTFSPKKIGFDGDNSNCSIWQKNIANLWYSNIVKSNKRILMELQRNSELIKFLGNKEFKASIPTLPMQLLSKKYENLSSYFVVFPGASDFRKMWPTNNFIAICNRVSENWGLKIVVCGGKNEIELSKEICNNLNNSNFENLTGKTTLTELSEIIRKAEFIISNDTSAIHIAAAVSTPSICILGGGHFGRFLPYQIDIGNTEFLPKVMNYQMPCYGCNWQCIYKITKNKTWPCILNVSVDDVWLEMNKLYKQDKQ